eukprot:CAMPEP_0175162458 /NCGR_PEP_ID=MMETSP0087-20121206/25171_1 /TAXON_ID=136419 /ORGANISM="Unknown Unknown, Strain D1" /LENGTH=334 /DNA_ID=CAMNT_0016450985 /DNA_START=47 /DNA_END=1053 /DNA_ORIENTATION=-
MTELFKLREPPPFKPLLSDKKRKMPDYMGVASFTHRFGDEACAPSVKQITPAEIRAERKVKKAKVAAENLEEEIAKWNPRETDGETTTSDAYKTLFVARLSYDVSEDDLKDEFEYYGTITKCRIIVDKKGKSRGYGFVEFESSRDLKEAYKDADGRKINGRRILVDVERGRTVKNWKPRRLGGGLGGTRIGSDAENLKFSGREPPRMDSSSGGRAEGGTTETEEGGVIVTGVETGTETEEGVTGEESERGGVTETEPEIETERDGVIEVIEVRGVSGGVTETGSAHEIETGTEIVTEGDKEEEEEHGFRFLLIGKAAVHVFAFEQCFLFAVLTL